MNKKFNNKKMSNSDLLEMRKIAIKTLEKILPTDQYQYTCIDDDRPEEMTEGYHEIDYIVKNYDPIKVHQDIQQIQDSPFDGFSLEATVHHIYKIGWVIIVHIRDLGYYIRTRADLVENLEYVNKKI